MQDKQGQGWKESKSGWQERLKSTGKKDGTQHQAASLGRRKKRRDEDIYLGPAHPNPLMAWEEQRSSVLGITNTYPGAFQPLNHPYHGRHTSHQACPSGHSRVKTPCSSAEIAGQARGGELMGFANGQPLETATTSLTLHVPAPQP